MLLFRTYAAVSNARQHCQKVLGVPEPYSTSGTREGEAGCHTRAGHWWPCGSGTALVAFGMIKEGWHASVEGREVRLQAWLRCLMSMLDTGSLSHACSHCNC